MTKQNTQPNPSANRQQFWLAYDLWFAKVKAHAEELARRHQIRREKFRLIENGTITPADYCKPQMMSKDASGRWIAEIRYV